MEKKRTHRPVGVSVKETVDFVYELLISNPDGYDMKAKDLGNCGKKVVTILVQRGIVERVRNKNAVHSFRYKWVAASAPTKVLYGSIAQELTDISRMKNAKYNKKRSVPVEQEVVLEPAVVELEKPEPAVVTVKEYVTDLSVFSSQELWDELKGRGYSCDAGGLYIIKRDYLD